MKKTHTHIASLVAGGAGAARFTMPVALCVAQCTTLIVATVITLTATAVPVCAQERSANARFDFAPNYFRREHANPPLPGALNKGVGHNGKVPQGGSSVLGINSKLLEKPTVVQTTVAAVPAFTEPTPPPKMPPAANFGKPATPVSPAVAHAKAGNFGKPAAMRSDRQVSGKLLHRPMHYKVPAKGLAASPRALDSYGNGFGYSPGAMVPPSASAPGNSNSVSKDVYGKLLRK